MALYPIFMELLNYLVLELNLLLFFDCLLGLASHVVHAVVGDWVILGYEMLGCFIWVWILILLIIYEIALF